MAAFTSSDEFDLERRVWMTNEIPPYDMYKSLHSAMKTPFWKWIIGTSTVGYDYPYEVFTEDKGYVRDTNSDEVYLKMTNGYISDNYGPQTPKSTYNRLEIDGVLMPEFDLLLHEIYRYTETLYPDHPDERYLLTNAEFNDMILSAAEMIDYNPNVLFFDKVASTLSNNLTNDDILDEAAKIKIRNLTNEAFRRKLYGSKAGYRMLANDIFQMCTIFPVATYLPLREISKERLALENATVNNKSALNALNMSKDEYIKYNRQHNRIIDTYSSLYYRKFRLVDWNGKNSSYLQKDDANTYFYGISIPFNENRLFEYPNNGSGVSEIESAIVGSYVENTEDAKGITYITDKNFSNYIVDINPRIIDNEVTGIESISSTNVAAYITTSHTNYIPYTTTYVYDNIKDILDLLKDHENNLDELVITLNNRYNVISTTLSGYTYVEHIYNSHLKKLYSREELLEKIPTRELKVILNPFVDDTLLLEPHVSLSFYPTNLDIYDIGENTYKVSQDDIIDAYNLFGKELGNIDLLNQEAGLDTFYYISNFTKGKVTYEPSEVVKYHTEKPFYYGDSRYSFIIENNNGDIVVLTGKLKPEFAYDNNKLYPYSLTLEITAIPEEKDDNLIKACYNDASNIFYELNNIKDDEKVYLNHGMTYEGCEDVIGLYNCNVVKYEVEKQVIDGIRETPYQAIQRKASEIESSLEIHTTASITCDDKKYFFYKASLEVNGSHLIALGTAAITELEDAILMYKDFSGVDYSNFIVLYIKKKAYEETISKYKKNREYIYETVKKADNSAEYEAGLIMPNCLVKGVLEMFLREHEERDYSLLNTDFSAGPITQISLGNLNILPIIDNNKEMRPYSNDNGVITLNECAKEYKYGTNDGKTLYYPEYAYYSKNNHIKETIDFKNDSVDYINNNYQAYSKITGSYLTNQEEQDTQDWFASFDGTNPNSLNVTCIPIKTYAIEIEGVVDVNTENMENVISFKSDIAKERAKALSVGDTVFGPTLDTDDNNIYITYIGDNYVKLNRNLQQSGTYVFTFNCRLNIVSEDVSNDMTYFRGSLDTNGIYSIINPFEHGLWGSADFPHVSNAILESLPDIIFYEPYNYDNGLRSSFDEVMEKIHPLYDSENNKRLPSTIKFSNDLFIEYNITKYTNQQTRTGVSPSLITVDWLDYMTSSLGYTSRATDHANVGINLMMETDTTGYYTLNTSLNYTDPSVGLKFITLNLDNMNMWANEPLDSQNDWTVPAYAQIGNGGSGRFSWFKSPADITYPTIWGNAVYDSDNITASDVEYLELNNGKLRRRSTWGKDGTDLAEEIVNDTRYTSVEKPIFEVPLGEYDIQTRYLSDKNADITKACTTVQVSFYQETFNKLTKYMDTEDVSSQSAIVTSNSFIDTAPINTASGLIYKGIWTPTKVKSENGEYYEIVYPTNPNENEYYTITESISLTNIGEEKDTKTFEDHTILLYTNNGWTIYNFSGIGLYGKLQDSTNLGLTIWHDANISFLDSIFHRALVANSAIIYDSSTLKSNFASTFLNDSSSKDYRNTILWYIYIGGFEEGTFADDADFNGLGLNVGDVFGIILPDTFTMSGNDANFDLKLVKLNKCYFTTTLKFNRLQGTIDKEVKYLYDGEYSLFKELHNGLTEIKLPRRCITEGSYNFDYIIDPQFISEGYLYTSSLSNEKGLEGYDIIENDNFDIIDKSQTVSFNLTRGAIYKDDTNNEYYVWTDNINGQKYDKLKKVALKFAEQRYFKNTLYITGAYTVNNELQSGSSTVISTPTLEPLTGINEFIPSYLSSGDRILKVTPVTLRSFYSDYLEPTFFSNYKNYDAEILGIDNSNNIVMTYDKDGDDATFNKNNFILNISQFAPVNKTFSVDAGKYVVEKYNTNYYDFIDPSSYNSITQKTFLPPNITFNKVTKSMLSDNKADNNVAEFKYYKNLLVAKVGISLNNPNVIYPAEDDSGQFMSLAGYINNGDSIFEGITLKGSADEETIARITIEAKNTQDPVSVAFVAYDEETKNFMAISKDGMGYFAENVNLVSSSKVETNAYQIDDIVSENTYVDGLAFENSDKLNPVWAIRVSDDNGSSQMFSVPVHFTLKDNGHIGSSGLFGAMQQLNNKTVPDTIKVSEVSSLSYDAKTDTGTPSVVAKYVNSKDYSVAEISGDGENITYINKPYAIGDMSKRDTVPQVLYAKDTNSDYAVYVYDREIFIKSPNYYCDSEGKYTNDLSKDCYWKKTNAAITRDTLQAYISAKIRQNSTNSGYDYVYTRWNGFKSNWDFLFTVDLVANDYKDAITNDGIFTIEPNLEGTDLDKSTYEQWKSTIETEIGPDATYDYVAKLQELIKKSSDILPINYVKIKDTLTKAKDNPSNIYYVGVNEDGTYIETTNKDELLYNSKRPWDKSEDSKTKLIDYLSIQYKDTDFEILHYGINKLEFNSTVNSNGEEVDVPFYYNIDARFDANNPTIWTTSMTDTDWYAEYLYLLDSYAYLDGDFENLFNSKIDKVLFSKDNIVFICKDCTIISIPKNKTYRSEDLEDIDNWNLSYIDDKYTYTVPDFDGSKSAITKLIKYGDAEADAISVKLRMVNQLSRIFTIKSAYSDSNVVLLGGYMKSMDTILEEYHDAYGEEFNNDSYQKRLNDNYYAAFYQKEIYPVLLCSLDGGKSFEFASISADLPGCELVPDGNKRITSSNPDYSRPAYKEPTKGMMIDGIHYINGKYKMHLVGSDNNEVKYQLYPSIDTITKSPNWKSTILYEDIDENESETTSSYEEFYSDFELFIYSSVDYFLRASYIGLNLSNAVVRSSSSSSIVFDSALTTRQQTGGRIEALVAFKTRLSITPQVQISMVDRFSLADYIEGDGFKVSSYIPVENIGQADRMFNYRETLTTAERAADDLGYRAVVEDTDHKYYKYDTCINTDNETVYTLKYASNSNSMDILLCDAQGNYISNTGTEVYSFSAESLLSETFDPSLLPKAGSPVYPSLDAAESDPNLRLEDTEFSPFGKTIMSELNFVNTSASNSMLGLNNKSVLKSGDFIVKTKVGDTFVYEIKDSTTTFGEGFTKASEDVNTISGEELAAKLQIGGPANEANAEQSEAQNNNVYATYAGPNVVLAEPCIKVQISEAEKASYVSYLYEAETDKELLNSYVLFIEKSVWGTAMAMPYPTFDSRFEKKTIGNKQYYFDKKLNVFPFKKNRYLNIDIYTDYALAQDQGIYTKLPFSSISDDNNKAIRSPITGIFLPQKGYGGLRNRSEYNRATNTGNSWSDELPWDLDPVAFDNSYMKNTKGDYIRLCNNSGISIDSNNGEALCEPGKTYNVYYKDIAYGDSKTIEIFKFANDLKQSISNISIYRPEAASAYIWLSSHNINVNYTNAVGNKQSLANIKFVIPSQFKFENVTYTIKESEDNTTWSDSVNFICEDGILKYTTPDSIESRPKYLKISYTYKRKTLEETLNITSTTDENVIYTDVSPIWYYKNNTNTVLENATLSFGENINTNNAALSYNVGQVMGTIKNTITVKLNDIDKEVSLPIFNIGTCNIYINPKYSDSTYDYKFFISDNKYVEDNISFATTGDDVSTYEKASTNTKIKVISVISNNKRVLKATYIASATNTFTLAEKELDAFTLPSGYLTIQSGSFVPVDSPLYDDSNISIKLKVNGTISEDTFIKGAISPIYMRSPKYDTFKALIDREQYIVNNSEVYYNYNREIGNYMNDVTFNTIEQNKVTFDNPLNIPKLNDGKTHYIRLEVLTQSSVPANSTTCNNNDYYTELDLSEMDDFPPDRVYFNEKGYPKSPITIDNVIYRKDNNVYYTNENFTNNNGSVIMECNEEGKLIEYYIKGGELKDRVLPANAALSRAIVPLKPNYMSCKDWFYGEFYIKGKESNPFWQVINLAPSFNSISQEWSQNISINKYEKVGTALKQVPVDEDDRFATISRASSIDYEDGDIVQEYNTKYLDLFNGIIRFILTQPAQKYYDNQYLNMYGIEVRNDIFYHKQYTTPEPISGYLQSTYTVNSRKNFANEADSDSSIVEITEFGLFNKAHQLLAYATFPPIEYRTDSQHASFTCFIKYGACTV